jgi:intein/homing endonuclease
VAVEIEKEDLEELYLRTDLAYFAEKILDLEIVDHHKSWSALTARYSRLAINAARDHGKTVAKSTTCIIHDGTVRQICKVRAGDIVLSLSDDWKAVPALVEHVQNCGLKETVKIITRTGRTIDAALTHPFRRLESWVVAGELAVGDRIAAPRVLPLNLPRYPLSNLDIKLLGHVLANGGVTEQFYISSEKHKVDVRDCLNQLGWDFCEESHCGNARFRVRGEVPRDWLERHGLFGKKSIEKEIPDVVFKLSNEQLALFLSRIYVDGSISIQNNTTRGVVVGKQIALEICLGSEKMVFQIQHLLLRLGILSYKSEKKLKYIKQDGETAKAWRLMVSGKESQMRFLTNIGILGEEVRCREAIDILETQDENGQNDLVPVGYKRFVKRSTHWHKGESVRETPPKHRVSINNDYDINRFKLLKVAENEGSSELLNLATSDVLWDEIVSIESAGMQECWDLQIKDTHNYVANDIFSHNSHFFSFAYAIWRCYYGWIPFVPAHFRSIPRYSLGYIFSSSQENAVRLLREVKHEIETNPRLEHLLPSKPEIWSAMEIKCANGSTVRARGWGVAVRGGHPCWAICDDILGDENLYSELMRQKDIEYFYSAVTPMVIPNGQIVVVGCVRPDTFVLTRDGPVEIGDLVEDRNFSDQRVINFDRDVYGEGGFHNASKLWVNGVCDTKVIKTTYGLEIECSHRHPIRVRKGDGPSCRYKSVWKRADEITVDDHIEIQIGQNVYGTASLTDDEAYFMGLWTSEGSSEPCGRLTICTQEPTLISYLKTEPFGLRFVEHQQKWRTQNKEFYDYLLDKGIRYASAEHKVVPKVVLNAPKSVQQSFIRGFADGDGCSYKNDSIQQINLASASSKLIFQIRAMLMNMGMLPSYMVKPGVSELVHGKLDSHQLVLGGAYAGEFMREIGFTVAHKMKDFKHGHAKLSQFLSVKSVLDGRCETVDFVIPENHTFSSNGFISHNTPFHNTDLYDHLAHNQEYHFFRYPALTETGEALWPTRYSHTMLERKKREVGNTRFTREYLCVPISDENTLFPEKVLRENYDDTISLVTELTPEIRRDYQIFCGIDLAMSASVAADYSVITTIGVDKHANRRLLDIRRFKGRTMTEQLREIEDVFNTYRPERMFIEDNQFQRVFRDELVRNTDLPIQGFTTTAQNKNSLERGVPSLQILFENKKFIIPRNTERDRRITDILLHELKCFTYVNGKLQGLGAHDDCVMSLWIANECSRESSFSFSFC